MASATATVETKSKKKSKKSRDRSSGSSSTESVNSIPIDSDGDDGPPIVLEEVAASEKRSKKKSSSKSSAEVPEAAGEAAAEKKHKKHKKSKEEAEGTKHKKKHKDKSESGGSSSSKSKKSKDKEAAAVAEAKEDSAGGADKPKKPKPPKPPPPQRTQSEASIEEASIEAAAVKPAGPPIPEDEEDKESASKEPNEAGGEDEAAPKAGLKAGIAFRWKKIGASTTSMWNSSTTAVKEKTTNAATAVKDTTYNATKTVKDSTVNAASAAKESTVNAASTAKNATVNAASNTASSVKNTTTKASSTVSSSLFGVVELARKAALETKHKMGPAADRIYLIHFNDVYDIESGDKDEPVGGAARFLTAVKSHSHLNPMVLFSGDCFAPSTLSTFTKGEQMVPVLNKLDVRCAVFGNHDFDFGIDILQERVEKTNFPWLISNVIDNETGQPLADGKVSHIVDWCGRKIGLIGLVEKEWLDTLSTINPEEVTYTDYVESGQALAKELRGKGCQFIIALTHMRTPNDIRLAENTTEIDLILGGHDHVYEKKEVNGTYVLKSGTDFRQFSFITVDFATLASGKPVIFEISKVEVTKDFEPDNELATALEKYSEKMDLELIKELGEFECDLEGRFSLIRTQETNLGNFICDIMVAATNADFALINSGTFRSDMIHSAGPFFLKDLLKILPMIDPLVLLEVTGKQLLECLENGVSMFPKLEGRFPQVSGISFAFDPEKPAGKRIDPEFVKVGDEYLDLDPKSKKTYRLATKAYLANGKDGYDVLAKCKQLIDEENGPTLAYAVQNHFSALAMREGKTRRSSVHHQSLVTLSRKHSIVRQLTDDGSHHLPAHVPEKFHSNDNIKAKLTKQTTIGDLENTHLNPKTEGRIRVLSGRVREELKHKKELDLQEITIPEEDDDEDDLR